ncbi:MAG TPA: hypothetical protein VF432_10700 [Thermoanaerobaculia bacterium]
MQFNLNGIVRSGGTAHPGGPENPMSPTYMPLPNVQVRLFDAGLSAPVDQGVTDQNGAFHLQAFHYGASSIYYVTASVSEEVVLMAVIGPALFADNIVVNELTTVAAVYSLAQFFNEQQVIEGPQFGLRIAALMNTNIVQVTTGDSSNVLTAPPNGDQTNAWRLTLSLANLLVTCVRDPQTACAALFNLTTPPGGTRPANTIAALLNIARDPANQVQAIYDQAHASGVYWPPLENVPDAWTLAVKVNDSGDNSMMFAGPGNIAFDRYGRAWIPNNVVQGQPYSCTWAILLDPAGRPAIDEEKQRLSPITGGGIIGGGFGVAIDANDHVWLGNFGWGDDPYYPAECVSELNLDTTPVSPAGTGGADRVQGTVVDQAGNVWFAGFQSHTVFVYINGSPNNVARYDPDDDTFDPFGIAIAADGTAWVTSTNSQSPQIVHLQLDTANNTITAIGAPIRVGAQNKGVVVDSGGNVWFAAASDNPANDCVYFFAPDGTRKTFQGGGMHGPWGIALDGGGNLWVGNFGSMIPENVFEGRVTRLASATSSNPGQPLTPATGYTLPTAGDPVTLANGDPLYGPDTDPCLIPMMRTTGLQVDAAGNVWTCNNWKPNFTADNKGGNPGGDGIVIFVGVATPVVPRGA